MDITYIDIDTMSLCQDCEGCSPLHLSARERRTYCASILSNNINGPLLHCEVTELRSVINMNFGDWELFMLVLSAMREDEESCPARPDMEVEATLNEGRIFRICFFREAQSPTT